MQGSEIKDRRGEVQVHANEEGSTFLTCKRETAHERHVTGPKLASRGIHCDLVPSIHTKRDYSLQPRGERTRMQSLAFGQAMNESLLMFHHASNQPIARAPCTPFHGIAESTTTKFG